MRLAIRLSLCFFVSILPQIIVAQDPYANLEQGLKPYGAYHGGDLDSVNITNGNLNLHIPLLSYPQRGGKLDLAWDITYAGRSWVGLSYQTSQSPPTFANWWQWQGDGVQITLRNNYGIRTFGWRQKNPSGGVYLKYVYTLYSADGSSHPLSDAPSGLQNGPRFALDASGLHFTTGGTSGPVNESAFTWSSAIDKHGNPVSIASSALSSGASVLDGGGNIYTGTSWTDPNGNQIAISSSTIADTVGRSISVTQTPDSGWSLLPMPWAKTIPTGPYQQVSGQTAASGVSYSTANCPSGSVSARQWTVPGYNDGSTSTAAYQICFGSYTVKTQFGIPNMTEGSTTNRFINAIILPNNTSWTFLYDSWGDLTRVTLPTGGYIAYTWGTTQACGVGGNNMTTVARYVTSRTVNDGTSSHTWTYNRTSPGTIVTDPDGNDTVYSHDCFYVYQVDSYQGSHTSGTLLKSVQTTYADGGDDPSDEFTSANTRINTVPNAITTILNPGSTEVTSKLVKTYDSGQSWEFYDPLGDGGNGWYLPEIAILGKEVEEDQYDYGASGSSSPGSLIRSALTSYAWQSPAPNYSSYLSANLLNYPVSVVTKNGSGTRVAETDYAYDQYSLNASGLTLYPPNGSIRANLTSTTRWLNGGTSPTTQTCFNDSGTKNKFYDANSVQNGHGCAAGGTATDQYAYSSSYAQAYLTGTTDVLGHTVGAAYDLNTGAMASFTDQNNQTTAYTYDKLVRPVKVLYPRESDSGLQGESDITYYETVMPFSMKLHQRIDSTNWKDTLTTFDGLGRAIHTQLTSDPQGTDTSDTIYDNEGRVLAACDPHRSGDSTYCTYTLYDALGRKTVELPQDAVTSGFNGIYPIPQSNYVATAYSGNVVTVTDQTSRTHQTATNALGWLVQVIENPSQGTFNNVSYPKLETDYFYDSLGNLYCLHQKGNAGTSTSCPGSPGGSNPFTPSSNAYRGRWFVYDSLSRLTDAYNPETGHTNWTYDGNSNVLTKTDAKGQSITYGYDSENRLTGKTFSAGDHAVTYGYDQSSYNGLTITNGIHHRTGMSDASGMAGWSYDERGRERIEKRTIGSVTNTITTRYNVLGGTIQLTYPNGDVISYGFDAAARVSGVSDTTRGLSYVTGTNFSSQCSSPSTTGVSYAASGAPMHYEVGYDPNNQTTAGINVENCLNSRLQPQSILAQPANTQSPATLSYAYGFNLGVSDNGDLFSLINNQNLPLSKNFTYDAYNRIREYKTPNSSFWDVQYLIDPWGNLTNKTPQSGYGGETLNAPATYGNQLTGYSYDGNGNMTSGDGNNYTYDSENRIATVAGVTYKYDGDGERVQKSTGETYWGGGAGHALLETDASGNPTAEYVHFLGKILARRDLPSGTLRYYFSDHLNSTTVLTDAQGNPVVSYDFAPYGESHWQSGSDSNHYKFTGKERDTETGNDYFGARYYQSSIGRFITPDWSATPQPVPYATLALPQTLNLYAYVANNPVTGIDPDGHMTGAPGADAVGFQNFGYGDLSTASAKVFDQNESALARYQAAQQAQQNNATDTNVTLPKGKDLTMVQTLMGEQTNEAAVGTNQYADDESGRKVGPPGGAVITDATLDKEANLMAGTMLNRGHIGNANIYRGLPAGKHLTALAAKAKPGSGLAIQLQRDITAVRNATPSPYSEWRSVNQGFIRSRGDALRVAGTDFLP